MLGSRASILAVGATVSSAKRTARRAAWGPANATRRQTVQRFSSSQLHLRLTRPCIRNSSIASTTNAVIRFTDSARALASNPCLSQWELGWPQIADDRCHAAVSRRFLSSSQRQKKQKQQQQVHDDLHDDSDEGSREAAVANMLEGYSLDEEDRAMIELLLQYREEHGDCHVPSSRAKACREERKKLGVSEEFAEWIESQRSAYRNKKISKLKKFQLKATLLESLGFKWSNNEAMWHRHFDHLLRFAEQHDGRMEVKRSENKTLNYWIENQRKAYKANRLDPEREKMLLSIGFSLDPLEEWWWRLYDQLCEYSKEHGQAQVPSTDEENKELAQWVARQRIMYSAGKVSQDRIRALEKIGFSWTLRQDSWEENYERLCKFYEEHGHTRVPMSNHALHTWVAGQRIKLRRFLRDHDDVDEDDRSSEGGRLRALGRMNLHSDDDTASTNKSKTNATAHFAANEHGPSKLRDLPLLLDVHEETWHAKYQMLVEYKKKHGHVEGPFPRDATANTSLSHWVKRQRTGKARGVLSEERERLLTDLGFVWNFKKEQWNRKFEDLRQFKEKYGHVDIGSKPKLSLKHAALRIWLDGQRRRFKGVASADDISSAMHRSQYQALVDIGVDLRGTRLDQ